MAFLAFAEPGVPSVPAYAALSADRSDVPASFTALEWTVVALAERDPLSSLRTPGRMAIALGSLFGERPNPKLADPKLEALRRLAVLTWHHGYQVAQSAVRTFLEAGFSAHQYELLTGGIVSARVKRRRKSR